MNHLLCIKVDEYQHLYSDEEEEDNDNIYYKLILSRISLFSFLLASLFLNFALVTVCNMSVDELHKNDYFIKILVVLMLIFYIISSVCYIFVLII